MYAERVDEWRIGCGQHTCFNRRGNMKLLLCVAPGIHGVRMQMTLPPRHTVRHARLCSVEEHCMRICIAGDVHQSAGFNLR